MIIGSNENDSDEILTQVLMALPENKVGKPSSRTSGVRHRATRKVYNRAADTLRLCAQSLTHSKSALGAKYRRLKARLGAPKAVVAMAHHFARLVYRMLRYGQNYVEQGIHQYELKFQLQRIKWLKKEARSLNLQLVPA
jgi:transposase